jgi:uncharacterized SAM-binding protein YcdF (DUF218 family)
MRRLFSLARICCTLLGLLLLVISFTPLVSWVARNVAVDWYDGEADVLVVLGGSMLVDGTGAQATLGFDSYLRCAYASWNLQHHSYRYIVVSGPNGLATAMAQYLMFRGTKRSQILLETAAQTTAQNAEFVKNILDRQHDLPPHPVIAILTSDYHTRRARKVFEHAGIPVRVIPVPDLAKRDTSITGRWNAFLDLSQEFAKDGFYKLSGKI